ncbi:MAG: TetR/AcrR family transcriptional regulator [Phyllobacteriaceae bacterium]|nr:TetR/AcrR family transcriptional regulator [Phyllobacteriaceae bacterium]
MRTKTDEKRREIVAAASAQFEEEGFERTSMAAIAARAGASKATLYGYFETKEQLFAVAMTEALEDYAASFIDELDPAKPLDRVLVAFGEAYLRFILSEQLLSIRRATLGNPSLARLGPELYDLGPMRAWREVAAFLDGRMRAGELRPADPLRAAFHLKGLLEAGMVEPAVQYVPPLFSIEDAAADATTLFLAHYRRRA